MSSRDLTVFSLALCSICIFLISAPAAYIALEKLCTFIFLLYISYGLSIILKRKFLNKKLSSKNKAVLITGCDSGFGHELAKRLDQIGYRVFAGCLFPEGEGALSLKQACSTNVLIVPLDVTDDRSVQDAKKLIEENLGNSVLWAVVNNAGIAQSGEIDWTPMSEIQRVIEINTMGTVRVTKAFLPFLRKSKGRIVNTTSSVGRFICPGFVGYCMSKSAAIAFTEGLRVELLRWGIEAISIEPFFYKTPLTTKCQMIEDAKRAWDKVDSETRQIYGEDYFENYKHLCKNTANLSSSKIEDVISCFEHAITAEEPQSTYFPCYFLHKIGILAFRYLPSSWKDNFQSNIISYAKPASLTCNSQI